jgi:hypothetical protein
MAGKSIIRLIVEGDTKGAQKALNDATGSASSASGKFKQFAEVAAASFAVAGAVAIDLGKKFVEAADTEDAATARLKTALKDAGESWGDYSAAVAAADRQGVIFGYDNADTNNALAEGVTATGSMTKSLYLLSVAQNLAAARSMDLNSAMMAVIKSSEGNQRAVKALGLNIDTYNGSAQAVKTTMIELGNAQQNYLDVQKEVDAQTGSVSLAQDNAVINAKQNLLDLEQRIQTSKTRTLAQEQELVMAQEKVKEAENNAGDSGVLNAIKLQQAQTKLQQAHEKYVETVNAGNLNVAAISKATNGQAAAQAQTFQGHVKDLDAEWHNFEADMGNKIIPVLEHLMSIMSSPTAFADMAAGAYEAQKALIAEANAAIDVYNAAIRLDNAGKSVGRFFAHFGLGTAEPNSGLLSHIAAPTPPSPASLGIFTGSGSTELAGTPLEQLITAWMKANPGKPLPKNLGGPGGSASSSTIGGLSNPGGGWGGATVVNFNLSRPPSAAEADALLKAHAKRNGIASTKRLGSGYPAPIAIP